MYLVFLTLLTIQLFSYLIFPHVQCFKSFKYSLSIEYSLNIGSEYEGKVSRLISMLLYTTDTVIHAYSPPNPMVSQLNIQCRIRWTCVRHGWNIDQLTCNHHIYSIIHRHPLGCLKQYYVIILSSYLTHILAEGALRKALTCGSVMGLV